MFLLLSWIDSSLFVVIQVDFCVDGTSHLAVYKHDFNFFFSFARDDTKECERFLQANLIIVLVMKRAQGEENYVLFCESCL